MGVDPPPGLAIGRHRFGAEAVSEKNVDGGGVPHIDLRREPRAARRPQLSAVVTVTGGPDFRV